MSAEEFTTPAPVERRFRDRTNARSFYYLPSLELIAFYTMAAPLRLQEPRFRTSLPWCFLGQIVLVRSLSPVIAFVADRDEMIVTVAFSSRCGGGESIPRELLRPGNTIMLMGAYQHAFPNKMYGIIVGNMANVSVCCFVLLAMASVTNTTGISNAYG